MSPPNKFQIDQIDFQFGEHRDHVRQKLGLAFKESNRIIPLTEFEPIVQRRDIYELNDLENFFFFNYTPDDTLRDIEIHNCDSLTVFDVPLRFDEDLEKTILQLVKFSDDWVGEPGNYIFYDLKITCQSQREMGSGDADKEGIELAYVYYTSDISHLEDERLLISKKF